MVRCAIDVDEHRALDRLRASLELYVHVPSLYEIAAASGMPLTKTAALVDRGDVGAALKAIPDELLRAMCVLGTPGQCREQLRRYDGLVDWIVLAPPSGPPDAREQMESIVANPWGRRHRDGFMTDPVVAAGALTGIRVLDCATLFAGPLMAMHFLLRPSI